METNHLASATTDTSSYAFGQSHSEGKAALLAVLARIGGHQELLDQGLGDWANWLSQEGFDTEELVKLLVGLADHPDSNTSSQEIFHLYEQGCTDGYTARQFIDSLASQPDRFSYFKDRVDAILDEQSSIEATAGGHQIGQMYHNKPILASTITIAGAGLGVLFVYGLCRWTKKSGNEIASTQDGQDLVSHEINAGQAALESQAKSLVQNNRDGLIRIEEKIELDPKRELERLISAKNAEIEALQHAEKIELQKGIANLEKKLKDYKTLGEENHFKAIRNKLEDPGQFEKVKSYEKNHPRYAELDKAFADLRDSENKEKTILEACKNELKDLEEREVLLTDLLKEAEDVEKILKIKGQFKKLIDNKTLLAGKINALSGTAKQELSPEMTALKKEIAEYGKKQFIEDFAKGEFEAETAKLKQDIAGKYSEEIQKIMDKFKSEAYDYEQKLLSNAEKKSGKILEADLKSSAEDGLLQGIDDDVATIEKNVVANIEEDADVILEEIVP